MPTYKFNPDPLVGPYFIHMAGKMRKIGDEFELDGYLSKDVMEVEKIEFVKDEPYVSPIICAAEGGSNDLEVPDCGHLVDIVVQVPTGGNVKLYFNNDNNPTKTITIYQSGTIFRSICTNKIRIINTRGNCSVGVIIATQYPSSEVDQFVNP